MKPWQCWTSPRIRAGLAWLSLMGTLGSSWPLQCSVVLVLGATSKQEIPEQGPVLDFLATQKHEQEDLFNYFLNFPVSQMSHSFSIIHIFAFNTNKNLLSFSTLPSLRFVTDLWLSGLLLHLVHFTQKKNSSELLLLSPYPVHILHKCIYILFLNYSLQLTHIFSNAEICLDEVVLVEYW